MATIVGPANSSSFEARSLTLIGGDNGNISDAILVSPNAFSSDDKVHVVSDNNNNKFDENRDNKVHVLFVSDLEIPGQPGIGIACSKFPSGCQVTETGGVQTGVTITWSNGAKDTVSFKSDTPEPTSLMLLGGGLLVVAGYLKRRLT
jgi:PEP-CTERM motif-containing protein